MEIIGKYKNLRPEMSHDEAKSLLLKADTIVALLNIIKKAQFEAQRQYNELEKTDPHKRGVEGLADVQRLMGFQNGVQYFIDMVVAESARFETVELGASVN